MLLFARMLDDLGGEPPLPEGPRQRKPGNPPPTSGSV